MPPYAQISLQLLVKAGFPPMRTVGEPGVHGPGIIGMQGIGVKTPKAAAVADATTGFARDWHIPNGIIFTIGTWSIIQPRGIDDTTLPAGST